VAKHSGVIGELALGHLRNREPILTVLSDLPQVQQASDAEVLHLIQSRKLMGRGIEYVDADLLASCLISATQLWTRDQRLLRVADDLSIAAHQ
jgi:predicted nucleic acid-binding protein